MDKNMQILKENIDRAVRKALTENMYKENSIDMIIENYVSENLDMLLEKHTSKKERKIKKKNDAAMRTKRKAVLKWLKSDEVNTAEIRRSLEGEPQSQEEEDAKRSYFMKKVNQTHGKSFNDDEINQLYSIRTSFGN